MLPESVQFFEPLTTGILSKLEIDGLRHIFDDVVLQQAPNVTPI